MKRLNVVRTVENRLHSRREDIRGLLNLSARIGRDPLLVQGSNGNTSIKLDGTLWIKASGKWLMDAKRQEFLVPVDLAEARESVRNNRGIPQMGIAGTCLRPSIETAMHCVLHDRVVVHIHSVNTIAWAIRCDARRLLEDRLSGLRWQWIPYVPSGFPLARQIEKAVRRAPDSNIFVLGNHGLVVCGSDCESVESLLAEVERRVSVAPRSAPKSDSLLLTLAARSRNWRLPAVQSLHALGTDPIATRILKAGVLFPCQAIFLGSKVRMLAHSAPLSKFGECASGRDGEAKFVIVEGGGTIVHSEITRGEVATLNGLAEVLLRTDERAPVRYLTSRELAGLTTQGPHPYSVAADISRVAKYA